MSAESPVNDQPDKAGLRRRLSAAVAICVVAVVTFGIALSRSSPPEITNSKPLPVPIVYRPPAGADLTRERVQGVERAAEYVKAAGGALADRHDERPVARTSAADLVPKPDRTRPHPLSPLSPTPANIQPRPSSPLAPPPGRPDAGTPLPVAVGPTSSLRPAIPARPVAVPKPVLPRPRAIGRLASLAEFYMQYKQLEAEVDAASTPPQPEQDRRK